MRYRVKRRRRLSLPHLVAAGAAAYVLFTGMRALERPDPCVAIDWISERAIPELAGASLMAHWPEPSEYADLIAGVGSGAVQFRGELSGERVVEISETCLILDRPEEARIHWDKRAGYSASLVSAEGLDVVQSDGIVGTRIGIRTAIDGQICAPSVDGPAAVLLAQLFEGIHARKDIAQALGERLGARRIAINEDIYRTSLISPQNYFTGKQILTYLVREGDTPLLINAYLENTAERVVDYGSGTFAVFEIIDLSPVAARLQREKNRCELGPERGPLPRLAL